MIQDGRPAVAENFLEFQCGVRIWGVRLPSMTRWGSWKETNGVDGV